MGEPQTSHTGSPEVEAAPPDTAMRRDFAAMPPEMQRRMLETPGTSGVECRKRRENMPLPFDERV